MLKKRSFKGDEHQKDIKRRKTSSDTYVSIDRTKDIQPISAVTRWSDTLLSTFGIYSLSGAQLHTAITKNDVESVKRITQAYFCPSYESLKAVYKGNIVVFAGQASQEMLCTILESYKLEINRLDKEKACQYFIEQKQFHNFILTQTAITHETCADPFALIKGLDSLSKLNFDYPVYEIFYNAACTNPEQIENLVTAFISLNQANTNIEHLSLYEDLNQNPHDAKTLSNAFRLLIQNNLAKKTHPQLYTYIVKKSYYAESLAKAFILLAKEKLYIESHPQLYTYIVKKPYYAKPLAKAFVLLAQEKLNIESYSLFSYAKNSSNVESLAKAFILLTQEKLSFELHPQLYIYIAQNPYVAQTPYVAKSLAKAFILLEKEKISIESHPQLYTYVNQNSRQAKSLAKAFIFLTQEKISIESHPQLYIYMTQKSFGAEYLAKAFILLEQEKINIETHPKIYDFLSKTPSYSEPLAKAIIYLIKENIHIEDQPELYKQLLKGNSFRFERIAKAFTKLNREQITYQENKQLYKFLINCKSPPLETVKSFLLLMKKNLTIQEYPNLYKFLAKRYHCTTLAKAFILLADENLLPNHYPHFYYFLKKYPFRTEPLAKSFILLKNHDLTYDNARILYQYLIDNIKNNDPLNLSHAFILFEQVDLSLQRHSDLYQNLIENTFTIHTVENSFKILIQAGLTGLPHKNLYKALIRKYDRWNSNCLDSFNDKINLVLTQLKEIKITYSEENKAYFSEKILIDHADLSAHIFKSLNKSGYNFHDHQPIIEKIISHLIDDRPNRVQLLALLSELVNYAKTNQLLVSSETDYKKQIQDLEALILKENILTQGPLNKSAATTEVERILKLISTTEISQVCIQYNHIGHYILTLPNEKKINLSILLKNANLTQLSLDSHVGKNDDLSNSISLVESLGKILSSLIFDWNKFSQRNKIVQLLPMVQQKAILIYTTEYYLNINRLFRGEVFDNTTKRLFKNQSIETNHLICFLLGCLITDAINKFPTIISETIASPSYKEELEYFLVSPNALLDRGEFLDEIAIDSRTSNHYMLPAITSFSAHENGSSYFHKPGTIRTKLENAPAFMPIINYDEREALFAHGTPMIVTKISNDSLVARIVNSPSLEKSDDRWSDEALIFAYKHYLSTEYKEEKSAITINNEKIVRPNHDSTHVVRVMTLITPVLNYFKTHANDPEFSHFCETITPEEIEWLRVAAAFSITGRESEISAGQNLSRYDQYREASAHHFEYFVQKTKDTDDSHVKKMLERMQNIVRYMGNPNYEGNRENQSPINCISDEAERKTRNFLWRILTIAHKLDLPRCYGAEQFMQSMQCCLEYSDQNQSQQNAFNILIRYSIDLIKVHGCRLSCDIQADDRLFNTSRNYQTIFAETSQLKRLYEVTQTVTRPNFDYTRPKLT